MTETSFSVFVTHELSNIIGASHGFKSPLRLPEQFYTSNLGCSTTVVEVHRFFTGYVCLMIATPRVSFGYIFENEFWLRVRELVNKKHQFKNSCLPYRPQELWESYAKFSRVIQVGL